MKIYCFVFKGTLHLTPAVSVQRAAKKFADKFDGSVIPESEIFLIKSLKIDFVL